MLSIYRDIHAHAAGFFHPNSNYLQIILVQGAEVFAPRSILLILNLSAPCAEKSFSSSLWPPSASFRAATYSLNGYEAMAIRSRGCSGKRMLGCTVAAAAVTIVEKGSLQPGPKLHRAKNVFVFYRAKSRQSSRFIFVSLRNPTYWHYVIWQ
jgi:hypothetical protein